VSDIIDLGRTVEVVVALAGGGEIRARAVQLPDLTIGASCRVQTDPDAVSVWRQPSSSGEWLASPRSAWDA
jgi:hypothetical protein